MAEGGLRIPTVAEGRTLVIPTVAEGRMLVQSFIYCLCQVKSLKDY